MSAKNLIPLCDAARLAAETLVPVLQAEAAAESKRLNVVALALSTQMEVFTAALYGRVRKMRVDELLDGEFAAGGRLFKFRDGRPPLARLSVRREELHRAITSLAAVRSSPAPRARALSEAERRT